jgi:hypothetical protein
MKRLLLFLILSVALLSAAVFVDGVNVDDTDCRYINLEIEEDLRNTRVFVYYGPEGSGRQHCVTDRKGETRYFHSISDALNFFYRNGWEIREIYTAPRSDGDDEIIRIATYYVLRRRANQGD